MKIGNREFDVKNKTYIMGILNAVSYTHLLRSSTPNNCSAVYQEELALLLIQASPHPLLIAFRNPCLLYTSISTCCIRNTAAICSSVAMTSGATCLAVLS